MKIRIGFNGSFSGLVYSAGYAYDPDCMYINGSGRDYYEFYIQLNRCGTLGKNALHDDNRKNPTVSGAQLVKGIKKLFNFYFFRISCGTQLPYNTIP